jgi:hypothetical protein
LYIITVEIVTVLIKTVWMESVEIGTIQFLAFNYG